MHSPICTEVGDLNEALYGSFLPVPSHDAFQMLRSQNTHARKPRGLLLRRRDALSSTKVESASNSVSPITAIVLSRFDLYNDCHVDPLIATQIGSHYHFIETNSALVFDRGRAYGKRLDIAAGTAVRFEPGDKKTVTLVAIAAIKSSLEEIYLPLAHTTQQGQTELSMSLSRRALVIKRSLLHSNWFRTRRSPERHTFRCLALLSAIGQTRRHCSMD